MRRLGSFPYDVQDVVLSEYRAASTFELVDPTDTVISAIENLQYQLQAMGVTVSSTTPTTPTPIVGRLWYNTSDGQFYVYDGSSFVVITTVGPQGLGVASATIDSSHHLILTRTDSSTVDAGLVPTGSLISLACSVAGAPRSGEQLWTVPVVAPFRLLANGVGSSAVATQAATNSASFALGYSRNGSYTSIGTITWGSGSTIGTFSTTLYDAQVGDIVLLTAPNPADPTLANLGIAISGNRTG